MRIMGKGSMISTMMEKLIPLLVTFLFIVTIGAVLAEGANVADSDGVKNYGGDGSNSQGNKDEVVGGIENPMTSESPESSPVDGPINAIRKNLNSYILFDDATGEKIVEPVHVLRRNLIEFAILTSRIAEFCKNENLSSFAKVSNDQLKSSAKDPTPPSDGGNPSLDESTEPTGEKMPNGDSPSAGDTESSGNDTKSSTDVATSRDGGASSSAEGPESSVDDLSLSAGLERYMERVNASRGHIRVPAIEISMGKYENKMSRAFIRMHEFLHTAPGGLNSDEFYKVARKFQDEFQSLGPTPMSVWRIVTDIWDRMKEYVNECSIFMTEDVVDKPLKIWSNTGLRLRSAGKYLDGSIAHFANSIQSVAPVTSENFWIEKSRDSTISRKLYKSSRFLNKGIERINKSTILLQSLKDSIDTHCNTPQNDDSLLHNPNDDSLTNQVSEER